MGHGVRDVPCDAPFRLGFIGSARTPSAARVRQATATHPAHRWSPNAGFGAAVRCDLPHRHAPPIALPLRGRVHRRLHACQYRNHDIPQNPPNTIRQLHTRHCLGRVECMVARAGPRPLQPGPQGARRAQSRAVSTRSLTGSATVRCEDWQGCCDAVGPHHWHAHPARQCLTQRAPARRRRRFH